MWWPVVVFDIIWLTLAAIFAVPLTRYIRGIFYGEEDKKPEDKKCQKNDNK